MPVSTLEFDLSSNLTSSVDAGQSGQAVTSDTTRQILLGSVLGIICLVSFMGNLLVVVAVRVESKLHTFTNYFIVSLACADMLISVLVMPLATVYEVLGRWPFNWWVCINFTTLDILCCTSSILNLCAISLDRYWAIITPFEYPRRMTRKTCPLIIAVVWVSSAVIAFAQIGWRYAINQLNYPHGDDVTAVEECQISTDFSFRIFSSSSSFWVPLLVMLFTYSKIYAAAKRQQQAITRQKRLSSVHNVTTPGNNGHAGEANGVGEGAGTGVSQNGGVSNGKTRRLTNSSAHFDVEESGGGGQIYETNRKDERGGFAAQWRRSTEVNVSPSPRRKSCVPAAIYGRNSMVRRLSTAVPETFRKARRRLTTQAAELKAFRILSVVMGAFIINWLPFFSLYVFEGICPECTYPYWLFSICLWLGYFNSSLNPFIYMLCNRQFRVTFLRLLTPHSLSADRRLRRERLRSLSCNEYYCYPPNSTAPGAVTGGATGARLSGSTTGISPLSDSKSTFRPSVTQL